MKPSPFNSLPQLSWLSLVLLYSLHSPIAFAAPQEQQLDDWDLFADTRQHSVGVRVGDSDGVSWGADLELILPGNTELAADYLQTELSLPNGNETLTSYWAQWRTDPLARWSVQLSYEQAGKQKSLRTEDFGLGLQYRAERWQLALRYFLGEVNLRTAPLTPQAEPRQFELDREAVEAEFTAFWARWQWTLSYLDYSYERRVRLNPDSLATLRRLGFNTFQQIFGLADWSAATELGYQHKRSTWRAGYSQYALELTGETGSIPYASLNYAISDRFSMGLMGALGLDDSADYGELSLRLNF